MRFFRFSAALVLLAFLATTGLRAAEASPAEIKLREALRNTLLQLRDAQGKVEALTATKTELEGERAALKAKLEETTRQAAEDKKAFEKACAQLKVQIVLLQRVVADHEAKNNELIKLANEILTRYEKFGIGEALTAKEPFTGLMRVKLQNLVQDYSDKVSDQRITHDKPAENPADKPSEKPETKP
ncbi:MAG: phage major capsid protein [Verrucomicrobiia bacterium]